MVCALSLVGVSATGCTKKKAKVTKCRTSEDCDSDEHCAEDRCWPGTEVCMKVCMSIKTKFTYPDDMHNRIDPAAKAAKDPAFQAAMKRWQDAKDSECDCQKPTATGAIVAP
jgi:hypothetical protein